MRDLLIDAFALEQRGEIKIVRVTMPLKKETRLIKVGNKMMRGSR